MNFKKYNSIENSYRQKFIEQIQGLTYRGKWHVSEKIHGTNFSLHTDGFRVTAAKRSGMIEPGEDFYGASSVYAYDKNYEKLLELFYRVQAEKNNLGLEEVNQISVYGELAGGSGTRYPLIQKDVYYSDLPRFLVFDIAVNGEFIDTDSDIYGLCTLELAPIIDICDSLYEALQIDCVFDSLVSGKENNKAEGVVIKPVVTTYLNSGARVIIKNKNPDFSEKTVRPKRKPTVKCSLPKEDQEIVDVALQYMTKNKLKNVISKMGFVETRDFGKLNGLFVQDILKSYETDLSKEKPDQHIIKYIMKETGKFIRKDFLNIIDGEY